MCVCDRDGKRERESNWADALWKKYSFKNLHGGGFDVIACMHRLSCINKLTGLCNLLCIQLDIIFLAILTQQSPAVDRVSRVASSISCILRIV